MTSRSGPSGAAYLEGYVDAAHELPAQLQRNFTLMRELDQRSAEIQASIEQQVSKRPGVVGRPPKKKPAVQAPAAKRSRPSPDGGDGGGAGERADSPAAALIKSCQACLTNADEKVALANQTYDLVDAHIRRLDKDLHAFEDEMKKGQEAMDAAAPRGRRRKAGGGGAGPSNGTASSPKTLHIDLDMPIDPNEPTYCFCKRVSFGEMIACDSPTCKIEWFHTECVGLTTQVDSRKGRWLCPDCVAIDRRLE